MRRFRDIIENIKAPSPQDLWLNGGELKFFGPNGYLVVTVESVTMELNDLLAALRTSGALQP